MIGKGGIRSELGFFKIWKRDQIRNVDLNLYKSKVGPSTQLETRMEEGFG